MKRRKPRLIERRHMWWRFYSVHAMAALGLMGALADWMPILREFIPTWAYVAVMTAGILGRIIKQGDEDGEADSRKG